MRGGPGGSVNSPQGRTTGHGCPEGAVRESQEESWQISPVSTTSGSKTWQGTLGGQQRKVEKGCQPQGWQSQNTSEGRRLRWFAHCPRGSSGHGCPEGAIRGTEKGSRQPAPRAGSVALVWERTGQRGVWRNLARAHGSGRLCGKERTVRTHKFSALSSKHAV